MNLFATMIPKEYNHGWPIICPFSLRFVCLWDLNPVLCKTCLKHHVHLDIFVCF